MSTEGRKDSPRSTFTSKVAIVVGVVAGYFAWSAFQGTGAERPGGATLERAGAPVTTPAVMPYVELPESPGAESPAETDDGPPAGGLRERSKGQWRVRDAASRQIVEIALRPAAQPNDRSTVPGMPPPPTTASCVLALEGGGPVRVFDRTGRERRCRVAPVAGSDDFEIIFEATGRLGGAASDLNSDGDFASDDGPFEIYYPAPGGKMLTRDDGGDDQGGISLAVYPATYEETARLTYLSAIAKYIRSTEPIAPPKRRLQIDDCTIPFDRFDEYVAVYRGYIACPRDGQYGFGVDADDLALVIIDGEQVLTGGRRNHLPDSPFPFRRSIKMTSGLHALTFLHVQRKGALRARFAWQPPGVAKMRLVPPSAFLSHLPARAVALERRDDTECGAFFSAKVTRRLVLNRDVPVTAWELTASGPRGAHGAEGLRLVWREGERVLGRQDQLGIYVSSLSVPEAGVNPWRDITLALEGPEGEVARYTRRLRAKGLDPREDEHLGLQLEVASAPTFVYPHEPLEIHVNVVNDSAEAVQLEAVEVRVERSPRRAVARRLGRFELPRIPEQGRDVVARRMNRFIRSIEPGECRDLERVVFLAGLPGAPAVSLSFEILGSRERGMPGLSAAAGALVVNLRQAERGEEPGPAEAGGVLIPPRIRRALFVLPFDSEGELRKWGMIGSIAFGSRGGKSLLYGDALASPGAVGGEGLGARMREALEDDGTQLTAQPFPKGAYPIHAACAGADAAFASEKWETIYVSLGLADCRAGTPPREFARGVDFLMDRASIMAPQARIVVVGPPPEWTREGFSKRYADAVREMVVRHDIEYVDLFSFMKSQDAPGADGREVGPDDGVRFPYPLAAAMDAIADEILSR
jgi:hypothetical protein